jgi:hypothetical protein
MSNHDFHGPVIQCSIVLGNRKHKLPEILAGFQVSFRIGVVKTSRSPRYECNAKQLKVRDDARLRCKRGINATELRDANVHQGTAEIVTDKFT